jgi:hypothetical protein
MSQYAKENRRYHKVSLSPFKNIGSLFNVFILVLLSQFLTSCSQEEIKPEPVIDPVASGAIKYILPADPRTSEAEWEQRAITLALTGPTGTVRSICVDYKRRYACDYIGKSCESGNANDCETMVLISTKTDAIKYYRLSCNYGNESACSEVKQWQTNEEIKASKKADEERAEKAEAEQRATEAAGAEKAEADRRAAEYAKSTVVILGSWLNSPIDKYIEANGAPTQIIPIGNGKTIYEFLDDRGTLTVDGSSVPMNCKTDIYVKKMRIYNWRTYGNTGICKN